ncbi:hypothetical protein KC951_02950 [Candidatus Saccharibacteria bacterium]|nr:hypothetical protein [Candidatus Saccharibacteria bacterium]
MIEILTRFAAACQPRGSGLFGLPTWYKYLPGQEGTEPISGNIVCTPIMEGINDIWLVVAAIVEILLRVAMLAAIFFVIAGGVMYMSSQGAPDKTEKAKNTIINALIGLFIAIAATTLVSFIAGRFS